MKPWRVLGLGLGLLPALLGAGEARGATQTFGSATYTAGPHPKRQTLWIRSPEIERRMVISISYERNYGPADRGRITGTCRVLGRAGPVTLREMSVEGHQAGDYYWLSRRVDEGEHVSCDIRFKKMPAVPVDGWAKLRIGVAEHTTDHASPWIEILSVTPRAGRRVTQDDLVQVDVRVTNPTTRTLRLSTTPIEEGTGFSPGRATRDDPALVAPGETARFLRTFRTVICGTRTRWRTEWVIVGLYDPRISRLYMVFDGAELKTTRLHPFELRCTQ